MRKAILPAIILILGLYFTAAASCSHKDLMPFFGKWSGGFVVESITKGPDTAKDRKRSELQGYLQVYGSHQSFKLHLEGEQEVLDLGGKWTAISKDGRRRLTLQVTDFKLDDYGGAEARDPNRKFIDPEDLRSAYAKPIVLDMSADKKAYHGLPMSIGNLIGKHEFTKDSF